MTRKAYINVIFDAKNNKCSLNRNADNISFNMKLWSIGNYIDRERISVLYRYDYLDEKHLETM